ncbi:M56 family metallopeptidase [Paenibacillus sedimenti]|uniref:M56 family metallopeptidase n=1 Tax=Paenibacillus sedimenti TaxID=2770274 RepID=UPI00165F4474|nr:M56 family metallopeptidase [Paenibacillus sedimenti]
MLHHVGMNAFHMNSAMLPVKENSLVGLIISSIFIVILVRMVWQIGKQILLLLKWRKAFKNDQDLSATININKQYPRLNNKIVIVKNDNLIALTLGFLKPKIVISNAWFKNFTQEEVEAILLHEHFHCMKRDPLKFLAIHILLEGMAYIPSLKSLVEYYKTWRELLADRYAMEQMKNSLALGSALLKIAKSNRVVKHSYSEVTAYFAGASINYRIQQIVQPEHEVSVPFGMNKRLVISIIVLFLNVLAFISCIDSQFVLHKFLY